MDKLVVLVVLVAVGIVIAKFRADAARQRKEVMARLSAEKEERGGVDYSPTAELFREVGVAHDPLAPLPPRQLPDLTNLPDLPLAPPTGEPIVGFDAPAPTESFADPAPADDAIAAAPADDHNPSVPTPAPAPAPASTPTGTLVAPASDLRQLFRGISMPAGLRPLGALTPAEATFVSSTGAAEVRDGLVAEFERLGCAARWIEPTVAQTERDGQRGLITLYPNPAAAIGLDGAPLFGDVAAGEVVVRMVAV